MDKKHFKYIFIVLLTFCVSFFGTMDVEASLFDGLCYCAGGADGIKFRTTVCTDIHSNCSLACGGASVGATWYGDLDGNELEFDDPKFPFNETTQKDCIKVKTDCLTQYVTERECMDSGNAWDIDLDNILGNSEGRCCKAKSTGCISATYEECASRNYFWDSERACCTGKKMPACANDIQETECKAEGNVWNPYTKCCTVNTNNSVCFFCSIAAEYGGGGEYFWSNNGRIPSNVDTISGKYRGCQVVSIVKDNCKGMGTLQNGPDTAEPERLKWADVPAILGNSFGFSSDNILSCEKALGASLDIIILAFSIVRYGALVLLIVLTAIDFMKAVANSDDSALKKATNTFTKRAVITVIIFILPAIINLVVSITAISSGTCGIG